MEAHSLKSAPLLGFARCHVWLILALALSAMGAAAAVDVPGVVAYQGRIATSSGPFTGTGSFKFALVNQAGSISSWSNDGSSVAGSEPTTPVLLAVQGGLFSVMLGDPAHAGMTTVVPPSVFDQPLVLLRIWFSASGGSGTFELLAPDRRLATAGYAFLAHGVADGAIGDTQVSSLSYGKLTAVPALVANGGATPAIVSGAADPTAAPASGVGTIYVATGSQSILRWDGTAWLSLAGSPTGNLSGDVTGPATTNVVANVGGVSAANVATGATLANAATSANTGSAIVLRDGSGNFSAGTITAVGLAATTVAVSGNASVGGNATVTTSLTLPTETSAPTPAAGMIRYNVAGGYLEYHSGSAWVPGNSYAP